MIRIITIYYRTFFVFIGKIIIYYILWKKIQKPFSEKRNLLFEKIKTLSLKQIQELKKKIFLNKNDNKNLNYIFFENNIDKQNSKI